MDEVAVDKLMLAALSPLHPSVSKNLCREVPKPDSFIVFDVEVDDPLEYCGDRDEGYAFNRRVHYYLREWLDPKDMPKRIRQALRQAGFTVSAGALTVPDPDKYTHIIIFAYILGQMDE